MNELKWVTIALSMSADKQFRLFPSFINIADDMAVTWETEFENLNAYFPSLSKQQKETFFALDEYIASISGENYLDVWTNDGVRHSDEWIEIRKLSKNIVEAMGWINDGITTEEDTTYIFIE